MVILDYPSSYYVGFQETGSINMYIVYTILPSILLIILF
jgi:hypothetical protein